MTTSGVPVRPAWAQEEQDGYWIHKEQIAGIEVIVMRDGADGDAAILVDGSMDTHDPEDARRLAEALTRAARMAQS